MPPIIAAVIGAAGAIGGGVIANRGAQKGANTIASTQRSVADDMLARTRPAYDKAYSYYTNLLSGDPDKVMSAVGPSINATNMQFNQARNNVMQNALARGGGLSAGLTNVEGMRAFSISDLIGKAQTGAAPALAALATGDQNAALQALAGAQQSNTQNALLSQQAFEGIGSFLTRLLTAPGLFGTRNNNKTPTFFNAPSLPRPVAGNSTWFNPANTDFGAPEINYFPNMRA